MMLLCLMMLLYLMMLLCLNDVALSSGVALPCNVALPRGVVFLSVPTSLHLLVMSVVYNMRFSFSIYTFYTI